MNDQRFRSYIISLLMKRHILAYGSIDVCTLVNDDDPWDAKRKMVGHEQKLEKWPVMVNTPLARYVGHGDRAPNPLCAYYAWCSHFAT